MPTKTKTPITQADIGPCEHISADDETVVRNIIARVADKWSLWALNELTEHGQLRFSRLMERVEGVSQKSLTVALRHLERDGLITRTVTVQVPIRVDYNATALGHAMIGKLIPLWVWAVENLPAFIEAHKHYDRAPLDTSRSSTTQSERFIPTDEISDSP